MTPARKQFGLVAAEGHGPMGGVDTRAPENTERHIAELTAVNVRQAEMIDRLAAGNAHLRTEVARLRRRLEEVLEDRGDA